MLHEFIRLAFDMRDSIATSRLVNSL